MVLYNQILQQHDDFLNYAFSKNSHSSNRKDLDQKVRKLALESFKRIGFPTREDEEYRYININEIVGQQYNFFPDQIEIPSKDLLNKYISDTEIFDNIIIINGEFVDSLSNISDELAPFLSVNGYDNSKIDESAKELRGMVAPTDSSFVSFNDAYHDHGIFLHVPKNNKISKPINVIHFSIGQRKSICYNIRNLIVAESGSEITIQENFHNLDPVFTFRNAVTEIIVKENANVLLYKLQNDNSSNSYLVDNTFVHQEKNSNASVNTFSLGGKIVRNNLEFYHFGENIRSFLNGVTVTDGKEIVDHHTKVNHSSPNCESFQRYKGIYAEQSQGVFNGKVYVEKNAQKTNAYQQNNNILLDEGAKIDAKPQLEIFADDVKCSHGCTVGQLDSKAFYYLRSRGIPEKKAKNLLIHAFAFEVIKTITIENLATTISALIEQKLSKNAT